MLANRSGEVKLIDLESDKNPVLEWTSNSSKLSAICFHPTNNELAVAFESGDVEMRNLNDGKLSFSFQIAGLPLCASFLKKGDSLAIGTNSGEIVLWNRDAPSDSKSIRAHVARVNTITPFPGGERFLTGSRDKVLKIWDSKTGQLVTSLFGHERQVFTSDLSNDGKTLVSGGLSGDIRIWRSE